MVLENRYSCKEINRIRTRDLGAGSLVEQLPVRKRLLLSSLTTHVLSSERDYPDCRNPKSTMAMALKSGIPPRNKSRSMSLHRRSPPKRRFTIVLVHLGFSLTGMFMVILGPALPTLAGRWSLSDSQAGYFFVAQFLGAFLTNILSGFLIPAVGFRSSFALGFTLMAFGMGPLGFVPSSLALVLVFVWGSGTGFVTAATNVWIGETSSKESGALSLVNFSWTTGAVACPFLLYLCRTTQMVTAFFAVLGAATALVVIAFATMPSHALNINAKKPAPNGVPLAVRAPDRFALILGALLFLYVGTETALGGWLATYSRRITGGADLKPWIVTPSFFWGGLMLGRVLGLAILRRITDLRAAQIGLALAITGTALLTLSRTLPLVFMDSILTGIGCSLIFPVLVSWLIERYGVVAQRVAGPMLAVSGLGAASVPWLVGVVSSTLGGLKAGLGVLILIQFGILGLLPSLKKLVPFAAMNSPSSEEV
jgi:MFS transporter, FHS family, glucose/mannose:H+ symporter